MIEYTTGTLRDLNSLKKLWISAFNDSAKGFRTFIKCNKNNLRIYTARNSGTVVAMLFHIPCNVKGDKAHYLYGAATDEKFRKRGIMKNLIEFSLDDAKNQGEKFSFLYPADDHLYGYYKRCGYERRCFRKEKEISRDALMHIAEYNGFCVSMTLFDIGKLRQNSIKGNVVCFDKDYVKYSVSYTKNYGGYVVCSSKGYAMVQQDEYKECVVSEIFAEEDDMYPLLGEILKYSKAEKFVFNYAPSVNIFDDEDIVPDGMVKFLSDIKLSEAYIGLTCF